MMADSVPPIDPEFASPADLAAYYRLHGLQVVPAVYPMRQPSDKRPALASWAEFHNEIVSDRIFSGWFPVGAKPNMGIITGRCSGNVFMVDLDVYKSGDAALWWEYATSGIDPETWRQTTGGGGKQVLLRAPSNIIVSNCSTSIGVDIRGQGGFAMLPPSQHLSGKNYAWDDGFAPWDCPIADVPEDVLAAVLKLIADNPGSGGHEKTDAPDSAFDAWGNLIDGRERALAAWVWKAVLELHRRTNGDITENIAQEAFEDCVTMWERHTRTRIPGVPNAAGLEREDRGRSALLAKWRHAMKKWEGTVAEEAAKPNPKPEMANADPIEPAPSLGGIHATPFVYIDPSTIPPREWVYGRHYVRRFLSTTVAPGGVGKSSLEIVELLAIASGRPFLNVQPDERCAVWYWNGEDPMEELQRRIMAAVLHFGIRPEEITDRFFVDSGRKTPIIVAHKTRDGVIINAPVIEQVIATIRSNNIGVLSIDPFVACHRVTENDNSEIERVAKTWAHIADEVGCAIELVHHVRKTNGNEIGVEDGRGAVALLAAARAARAINRMSPEEATKAGITDHQFYFRTDNGKANLAPPALAATWFHLASVDLHNETPTRPSDRIGVVEAWQWPDHSSDITASDMEAVRAAVRTRNCREDRRSPDWVGFTILQALGIDRDESGQAKAQSLLKMWLETDALRVVEEKDEQRRWRKFVRCGSFKER